MMAHTPHRRGHRGGLPLVLLFVCAVSRVLGFQLKPLKPWQPLVGPRCRPMMSDSGKEGRGGPLTTPPLHQLAS